jgi:hypothetical protein
VAVGLAALVVGVGAVVVPPPEQVKSNGAQVWDCVGVGEADTVGGVVEGVPDGDADADAVALAVALALGVGLAAPPP